MIRRVIKYLRGGSKPELKPVDRYVQQGNVIVGKNSELDKLQIHIFGAAPGRVNIEIGEDCMLEGSLVLYRPEARIRIGNRTFIGGGTSLFAYEEINIGEDVMLSWNCNVIDTNTHSLKSAERLNDVRDWKKGWQYKDWSVVGSKGIVVGDKCWIGFNAILMKGVNLGEGCVVGAGSVVTKSFEAYSVIGGNPAAFIKKTT